MMIHTLIETVLIRRVFLQHLVQLQYIRRRFCAEVVICAVKTHDDVVRHGLWVETIALLEFTLFYFASAHFTPGCCVFLLHLAVLLYHQKQCEKLFLYLKSNGEGTSGHKGHHPSLPILFRQETNGGTLPQKKGPLPFPWAVSTLGERADNFSISRRGEKTSWLLFGHRRRCVDLRQPKVAYRRVSRQQLSVGRNCDVRQYGWKGDPNQDVNCMGGW